MVTKSRHIIEKISNKSVLVTGGAGFIGALLTQQLVEYGACVTVLDNLSTGLIENLQSVKQKINFIIGDIENFDSCMQVVKNQEIVFHLAALTKVQESLKDPSKYYHTNVIGTSQLLTASISAKVKRFIFSSSAAVYGEKEKSCHEDDLCLPTSPYGNSKLIGELFCKSHSQQQKLETVCLRYFNVYSTLKSHIFSSSSSSVIDKFKKCMSTNTPVTIFGDGTHTRDFVSVEEVVRANIYAAITTNRFFTQGTPVNIASGKSISMNTLFHVLKKKFPQYSLDPQFAPAKKGELRYSKAVCQRYKMLCQSELKK